MPSYVSASPVGFHVNDLRDFLDVHPTHISSDPERRTWATEEACLELSNMFPDDTAGEVLCNLFLYNKTRDVDRICPSCRRVYRVGEAPQAYESFEAFLARDDDRVPKVNSATREEQDLSGICSGLCFEALIDGFEYLSAEEINDWAHCNAPYLAGIQEAARQSGFVMRNATADEWASSGIKLIWEKKQES